MPKLEYFIVCRSVSFDIDTDEITLSNVIEEVYLESDGRCVLPRIVAVSLWNVIDADEGQDFQTELKITRPGESHSVQFAMNLERGQRRHRAMLSISDIPLEKPGELTFEILLNGQHGASHGVTVRQAGDRNGAIERLPADQGRD